MYKSELFKEVIDYTDYFVPAGYGVDVNVNSNDTAINDFYSLSNFASRNGSLIVSAGGAYPSNQAYPRRYIINPNGYNAVTLYCHTNRQYDLNLKAYAIVKKESSNVYESIEIANIRQVSTAGLSNTIRLRDELEDTKLIVISIPGHYFYDDDIIGVTCRLQNLSY